MRGPARRFLIRSTWSSSLGPTTRPTGSRTSSPAAGRATAGLGGQGACARQARARRGTGGEQPRLWWLFTINPPPWGGGNGKCARRAPWRARLYHELESNVALQVESSPNSDHFQVSG